MDCWARLTMSLFLHLWGINLQVQSGITSLVAEIPIAQAMEEHADLYDEED